MTTTAQKTIKARRGLGAALVLALGIIGASRPALAEPGYPNYLTCDASFNAHSMVLGFPGAALYAYGNVRVFYYHVAGGRRRRADLLRQERLVPI